MTIFWKCYQHARVDKGLNFRISFIINDNFSLDFTLRTREQRHRYFGQVNTPASRDLHAPEVEGLQFKWTWISIFCDDLSDDQAILFQVYYKIPASRETSCFIMVNSRTSACVFYRDYLPLHHSWSDLVLCALWTTLSLILFNILLTFTNFGLF